MPKSKVKSLVPFMKDGSHATWTDKSGKLFYSFAIELEDGTKGNVLGQKPTGPAYGVGDTITFDLVDGKIKTPKKLDEQGNQMKTSQQYFSDPSVQKSITVNHCMRLAVIMCTGKPNPTKGDFLKVTNAYIDWCYKGDPDNQLLLNRRAALERAMEACELPEEGIGGSSKVLFEFAEQILEWTLGKLPKAQ